LNDEVMNYDPGQKDIYRFSVRIADSEGSGIFSCRLRIVNSINGHQYETYSKPFWVAKYFGGQTNRNVYAKFHTDEEPSTSLAYGLRHVDGINSVSRPPQYTTHSFLAELFRSGSDDFDIPGIRPDRTKDAMFSEIGGSTQVTQSPLPWSDGESCAYALKHLTLGLIGKPRTTVQKLGFTINDRLAPNSAMVRFDWHTYESGGSKNYESYINHLTNNGAAKQIMEVYRSNSTRDYTALQLSIGETVVAGKPEEVKALSDALVGLSHEAIDVAAKVDLAPLVGVLNTPASLDRLTEFLRDDNPVVQHATADALADYRWPSAGAQLWLLVNSPIPYVRDAATSAFEMSATNREAELLKNEIVNGKTKDEELHRLCTLLIQVSPALAETLLKTPDTRTEVRTTLVALTAN
jgi:hypothetical protein